ncbi:MAG: AAA family ATPase, partial [Candidatus Micrarchaeota archaeon]|nr:AAA family ATPase [Candidatus Micrarchaeota archaeon]
MILSQRNPSALSELIGNSEAFATAKQWAQEWQAGTKGRPLLLYGPTGVGKTALAHAVASEFNWQLFEFNASDLRDAESVEQILSNAANSSSLFGGMRLILIDDVDALSG